MLTASAAAQTDSKNAQQPYRVGVILPLSGQVASLGTYVRKGLELAQGSLPPEERNLVRLIFEDDQFDPAKTVVAYQRLDSVEGLDAVFVIGSPPANALAPLTEHKQQILVAIGASDPSIVAGRQYAFIHWVIPPVLGQSLAEELVRRDFKAISFISGETSGAQADVRGAVEALQALGAGSRIVYNQSFAKEETDFRTAIAAMRQKHSDVVVVVLYPGAISAFLKQARSLKLGAEIAGMETFEDESEVRASQGALVGAWYVNAARPTDDFVAMYKKAYGEYPGWASANAFDTLKLINQAAALSHGGHDEIRKFLATLKDYHGAAGLYSASGDNRFQLPAVLKRVTASGFEEISNSAPAPLTKLTDPIQNLQTRPAMAEHEPR